jgi:hypothetical protein
MNRVFKQLAIFIALLSASIILTYPYGEIIKDKINKNATSDSYKIHIDSVQANLLGRGSISSALLTAYSEGLQIPFLVNTGSFNLSWLSLLSLSPTVEANGFAYNGTVSTLFKKNLFSDIVGYKIELRNLDLAKHPLFSSLGFRGQLSLTGQLELTKDNKLFGDSSFLNLNIDNGYYSGGHTIFGIIKLPNVDEIKLELKLAGKPAQIEIQNSSLSCSLGRATLDARIAYYALPLKINYQANSKISLEPEGARLFGGYLGLLAGDVNIKSNRWTVEFSGDERTVANVKARPS